MEPDENVDSGAEAGPAREPVIASYAIDIVLRAPEGTPAPTIAELSEKIANGLGWGYTSTIEGTRTDR